MCPSCGKTFGVQFALVWQVFCWVMVCSVIFGAVVGLIDLIVQIFMESK